MTPPAQPPDLAPLLNAIALHDEATSNLRSSLAPWNGDGAGLVEAESDFKRSVTNILALLAPLTYWAAVDLDMQAQRASGEPAADGVTPGNESRVYEMAYGVGWDGK